MGYYLSQANRKFLEREIIPLLQATKETITLKCNDAKYTLYLIRNASSLTEYSWVRDKFRIAKKDEFTLVCHIKHAPISITDSISEHNDRVDILDIINILIQDHPQSIRFTNAFLTETEELRLGVYCKENYYSLTKDKRGLTLILNE